MLEWDGPLRPPEDGRDGNCATPEPRYAKDDQQAGRSEQGQEAGLCWRLDFGPLAFSAVRQ